MWAAALWDRTSFPEIGGISKTTRLNRVEHERTECAYVMIKYKLKKNSKSGTRGDLRSAHTLYLHEL